MDTYVTNMFWADTVKAKHRKLQLAYLHLTLHWWDVGGSGFTSYHGTGPNDSLHGATAMHAGVGYAAGGSKRFRGEARA